MQHDTPYGLVRSDVSTEYKQDVPSDADSENHLEPGEPEVHRRSSVGADSENHLEPGEPEVHRRSSVGSRFRRETFLGGVMGPRGRKYFSQTKVFKRTSGCAQMSSSCAAKVISSTRTTFQRHRRRRTMKKLAPPSIP